MRVFIAVRRMPLIIISAAVLCLLVLTAFYWRVHAVTASEKLLPVYEVDTPQNAVSISFDASWGAEHTEDILDILDEYGIKTTFFLVNIWVEEYPELTAQIVERGHELGLHSVTHPDMTTLSAAQIESELKNNYNLIKQVSGFEPTLFRAPFGAYNNTVISCADKCGYTTVQWSIDSLDWQDLSADEIYARVTSDLHSGDIVLFHNNGLNTAAALPKVLDHIKQMGLDVIPISDLLLEGDWYVDNNGVQKSDKVQRKE